jgi:hypothetical protein
MSAETEPAVSATAQPAASADSELEVAQRELRRALIQGIARRVGKSLESLTIQDATPEIPLEELYRRKVRSTRFSEVAERFLFRWWR